MPAQEVHYVQFGGKMSPMTEKKRHPFIQILLREIPLCYDKKRDTSLVSNKLSTTCKETITIKWQTE